jgi:uncharacterized membrane protein
VRPGRRQPVGQPARLTGTFASGAAGALFFTRWVTHVCAPTFVLLAGVGAHLYGAAGRKSMREVARFLLSRGAWLVCIELTLVNFAWNFNLRTLLVLGVIWAIGWSMIGLAALVWLPRLAIAVIGLAIEVGHNLLDGVQPASAQASPLWLLLHIQGRLAIGGAPVAFVLNPLVPWIGVMAIGYAIGPDFAEPDAMRPRRLVQTGALGTLAFLVFRGLQLYGEPTPWDLLEAPTATLIGFLNVTKYPPSLQFLLMTLGPALMLRGTKRQAPSRSEWRRASASARSPSCSSSIPRASASRSAACTWRGYS